MKKVALTFDVGHPDQPHSDPHAVLTVLDHLERAAVQGTFFLQGFWAGAYPRQAEKIAAAGHLIGVHSHWHAPYDYLTEEGVNDDLERSRKAVLDATGRDPRPWLRLPYGSGATDEELLARLARLGYMSVYWNVDPRDWDPNSSARVVASSVIDGVSRLTGPAVALFHGWSIFTMTALPWIINDLSAQCEFVMVDYFDHQWLSSCR